MATGGIGTRGSVRIRSFRATESSTTHSAGASTHHGWRLERRTLGTATVVSDTVTVWVMATVTGEGLTIVSDQAIILQSWPAAAQAGSLGMRTRFAAAREVLAGRGVSAAVGSVAPAVEGSEGSAAAAVSAAAEAVSTVAAAADAAVSAGSRKTEEVGKRKRLPHHNSRRKREPASSEVRGVWRKRGSCRDPGPA
ncbi:hypothetical protein SBA4_7050002 [Candidatus Sulfopaludibacter sp. SbA4]|nr:hypothetical protein SBA4_7050002 [Candidatus Sulfopaludibacter sp. SbA4]